jgi:hypothetical protein
MELFIIMATIAVICRDPVGTIKAANAYKRTQIEKARLKNPKVKHPGHRALRNYIGTVWETQWNDAAERYPEQMRAARERREARRAAKAERRAQEKEGRGPEPTPPAPKPAPKPAPAPVPVGVVDLDEERRRRAADEPAAGTGPAAPDEGNPMSVNLSDATSLRSHLAALREHASYQDRTCTAKEQLAAGMRTSGVGEGTVASVDASRAASAHAAAMARAAADALEAANMSVAEARASSPDAADGDYYERR